MLRTGLYLFILCCSAVSPIWGQWELVGDDPKHPTLCLVHVDGTSLYAVDYLGTPAEIFLTDIIFISHNEGETWEEHQLKRGFKIDGSAWLAGTSYLFTVATLENNRQVLMRSKNSGLVWEQVMPEGISSNWTKVFDHAGDSILLMTNHGHFRSSDGGSTWERTAGVGVLHKGYVYGVTSDSLLYEVTRSSDFGATWGKFSSFSIGAIPYFSNRLFSVDSCLFIVSNRMILDSLSKPVTLVHLTHNGGFFWINLSDQFDANTKVVDMARNNGVLYMLYSPDHQGVGTNTLPHLYTSSDGGILWQRIPANIPEARDIFFNDSKVFISSPFGAYVREKLHAGVTSNIRLPYPDISITPNPVSDHLTLNFAPTHPGTYSINLSDLTGRQLQRYSVPITTPGPQSLELDLPNLPSGTYLLTLENGSYRATSTFLVRR